jgi:Hemerythrin HHE cation binding domain
MDAIEMLEQQHHEVEAMFKKFKGLGESAHKTKGLLVEEISDALAMHAAIEEKHFYPAVKAKQTKDILLESLEEHLGIKRVLADLLDLEPTDETFDAKVTVLEEQVEHHVKEERTDLFPKAKKLLEKDELVAIAETMQKTMARLQSEAAPREAVAQETKAAAPLP